MCKASRFVTVKSARGAFMLQVNMPLSLKADKVDDFTKALQDMADLATINEDGKVIKHSVRLIDDLPTVYAVSMGIVTVDRKNMTGVAVSNAKLVSECFDSDKKKAVEDLKKGVQRIASDNDYCDSFNWQIKNNIVNRMTAVKTERHDRVNKRNSQTGNIERAGRVDVRAWCDTVRSLTQCKIEIVKTFI